MRIGYSGPKLYSLNNGQCKTVDYSSLINTLNGLNIFIRNKTKRGTRAGRKFKPKNHNVNNSSQTQVKTCHYPQGLHLCLINIRSLPDKCITLTEHLTDQNCDIGLITERWLNSNTRGSKVSELKSLGYNLHHVPRKGRGGGVGVLSKHGIATQVKKCPDYQTFENIEVLCKSDKEILRLCLVYRPPVTKQNNARIPMSEFFSEFATYYETIISKVGKFVIAGDFNIHVDSVTDTHSSQFKELFHSFGLVQHVDNPTHRLGHTLDLLLTKADESIISQVIVIDPQLSDHSAVHFIVPFKPQTTLPPCNVEYRKFRNINKDKFKEALLTLPISSNKTLEELINDYNKLIKNIIDVHAPKKTRRIVIKPENPWFCDTIRDARKVRRKAERTWVRTGLSVHKQIYITEIKSVAKLVESKKKRSTTILKSSTVLLIKKKKKLFNLSNELLNSRTEQTLPDHESLSNLADIF
ncbi:hypothetical protein SNE40_001064 [Patella caerulea]|uniref:Endonuclease/exonuclease/phosphatase domain-containing protein n=1 Tax=Patella caerulea TaxID=87958 RepID=A0AAN8KLT7_PATCE